MERQALIKNILARYGHGLKDTPFNPSAWEHYYADAVWRKLWSERVTTEFLAQSCAITQEMYQHTIQTPTAVLAAEFYAYGYYRATARQGTYWIDPQARDLWATFGDAK